MAEETESQDDTFTDDLQIAFTGDEDPDDWFVARIGVSQRIEVEICGGYGGCREFEFTWSDARDLRDWLNKNVKD